MQDALHVQNLPEHAILALFDGIVVGIMSKDRSRVNGVLCADANPDLVYIEQRELL
jgi:hypothetical protein